MQEKQGPYWKRRGQHKQINQVTRNWLKCLRGKKVFNEWRPAALWRRAEQLQSGQNAHGKTFSIFIKISGLSHQHIAALASLYNTATCNLSTANRQACLHAWKWTSPFILMFPQREKKSHAVLKGFFQRKPNDDPAGNMYEQYDRSQRTLKWYLLNFHMAWF